MLEVLPGMTVWDILMRDWNGVDVNQIGRQPPLSPNKAKSHFPRLKEATGVRYDKMLFVSALPYGIPCLLYCSLHFAQDSYIALLLHVQSLMIVIGGITVVWLQRVVEKRTQKWVRLPYELLMD